MDLNPFPHKGYRDSPTGPVPDFIPFIVCVSHDYANSSCDTCPVLGYEPDHNVYTFNKSYLLESLRIGHYKCCRHALTYFWGYNPGIYEDKGVITALLLKNRSKEAVPALELLLEFNFPVDVELLSQLEFQDGISFSEDVVSTLREHGLDIIPTRFSFTKSSAK